jgi:cysteine desulfurase/selenocysteine lyase
MKTSVDQLVSPFDVSALRRDFPILQTETRPGKPLVYLDNGATSQKPLKVIEAERNYYLHQNSNVHRGVHYLSDLATRAFESTRDEVASYIGASKREEVIFTKGTTEAINLVANTFGRKFLNPGDEVIISGMEHHANIVPWHMVREWSGIEVKAIPVTGDGELDMETFHTLLSSKTKLVAVTHVSNTLGTINPVKRIVEAAHAVGAAVLVDGAQAMPHMQVDVQDLGVDFYVFSSHKVFGPTGVGVLYGKSHWLEALPPYQGGGDMIDVVTLQNTTFNAPPHRFEAGTPNIAGVVAFGEAIQYLKNVDLQAAARHEHALLSAATEQVLEQGFRVIGQSSNKVSVLSFISDFCHPSDVGTLLDMEGIAVRTGHHCTQPLMSRFGIPGTIRASFAFYNTMEEVERFGAALKKAVTMLK